MNIFKRNKTEPQVVNLESTLAYSNTTADHLQPQALAEALTDISIGDRLLRRDYTAWFNKINNSKRVADHTGGKTVMETLTNPFFKSDKSYAFALKNLEEFVAKRKSEIAAPDAAADIIPEDGELPTQNYQLAKAEFAVQILKFSIAYNRDKLVDAKTAIDGAVAPLGPLASNADLRTIVTIHQARLNIKQGEYGVAQNGLNGEYIEEANAHIKDRLSNVEEVAYLKAFLHSEMGQLAEAATQLSNVYSKNPKRVGIKNDMLALYGKLAEITENPAFDIETDIDNADVRSAYKEAVAAFNVGRQNYTVAGPMITKLYDNIQALKRGVAFPGAPALPAGEDGAPALEDALPDDAAPALEDAPAPEPIADATPTDLTATQPEAYKILESRILLFKAHIAKDANKPSAALKFSLDSIEAQPSKVGYNAVISTLTLI